MNLQVKPHQTDEEVASEPAPATIPWRFLIGGVALIALLTVFYFYTHAGNDNAARGKGAAAPVKVAAAVQRDMPVIERTIGTVVANSMVSVTARVQGQLVSANFKEGQLVKKGDLLFQIDPGPYQAAYDSAMAALASARTNAERSANLLKQNSTAPQANDNAQAAF